MSPKVCAGRVWDGQQFSSSQALDEAYLLVVGAFSTAWDEGMVARWSANPFGMCRPEMDAPFVASGGSGVPPSVVRRPVVIVAEG